MIGQFLPSYNTALSSHRVSKMVQWKARMKPDDLNLRPYAFLIYL